MEFTTRLELQSQATRLVENTYIMDGTQQITNGILTLSDAMFQWTYTCCDTGCCFDRLQFSEEITQMRIEGLHHSRGGVSNGNRSMPAP